MTNRTISDPLITGNGSQDSTKVVSPAKEKNYTPTQQKEMEALYLAHPCRDTVNTIAKSFGKSERSVIAKLSNMKIYVAPPKTTKSGSPIVKKSTLVEHIGALLEDSFPSLEKANKIDLEKLLVRIEEWTGPIDMAV
jgi:hypothetical protein